MRNAFLIVAGSALMLAACNSEKAGTSDRAKKNLDAMHGVSAAIKSGDFSKLSDYMAPDIIDYAGDPIPKKGIDSVKADLEKMISFIDDRNSEVVREVADDDYAISWMKFTGVLKQEWMGKKAGDKFESEALEVSKFNADGKMTEHWTFMEPRVMMQMMGGGAPPPPPPAKADTAK